MAAQTEKKVYDYEVERVRDRLLDAFRDRRGEATSADLVALTGLPKVQVETEVKAVSDEYGGRLRVTESGEILYSFPSGMRSRYRGFGPSLKRFWKAFKKTAMTVGTYLFKAWIVVMLVGYFLLFIALAIVAMLASVAISASGKGNRNDRRGGSGGLGGFFVVSRLFDAIVRIWLYSELFKDPRQREIEARGRFERRRERRPLYKAVFSFVFGDGDPNASWDEVEKKTVVAFLQTNKGIITLPEFMAITGLPPIKAEERINRYLYEFEGSPEVTEGGAIYFSFPGLLRRKDSIDRTHGFSIPMKRIAAFSSNPGKANLWFSLINGANVLFGSYFLYEAMAVGNGILMQSAKGPVLRGGFDFLYSMTAYLLYRFLGLTDPASLLAPALGIVPIAFSVLFFAIPAIRRARLAASNEALRFENLRRIAYRAAIDTPEGLKPEAVVAAEDAARPKDPRSAEKALLELAAWSRAEPGADGSYSFAELARIGSEVAKARSAVKLSDFELGGAVFDSHS
jgi:hypothetical protein